MKERAESTLPNAFRSVPAVVSLELLRDHHYYYLCAFV
ncbi:hypothetical protein NC653_015176 [Populus alba x Populus x berolinensis]|uniref:Uncharacterized protein n=1 Tax=Populus alba x Populus x berolinensis TaxID=444605 RepID=A0AAD6VY40_9ROSI|nr:hypothetical protein NC653_015176 [Populus alba x Populus x berolinensis]